MGFRGKWGAGIAGCFLLWTATGMVVSQEAPLITVLVNNSANVAPPLLNQAKAETSRVFHKAGIEIEWRDCSSTILAQPCLFSSSRDSFLLHIVPNGKTSTGSVFGEAFLGADGTGKYIDVFFDRIQEAGRKFGTNNGRLLGTVSAHELGHLLLGTNAHAHSGIMEPVWEQESLRRMAMGRLLFTREQSMLMKARVERSAMAVNLRRPVSF
jgi:hypothetical protein